jgi:hypothetical protein
MDRIFNVNNFSFSNTLTSSGRKYYFMYKDDNDDDYCIEGNIIFGYEQKDFDVFPYISHIEIVENGFDNYVSDTDIEHIEEVLENIDLKLIFNSETF